jgi:hypothetical protein
MILVSKTVIQLFGVEKPNLCTFELTLSRGLLDAKCRPARGQSPSSPLWPQVQYTHENWQITGLLFSADTVITGRWTMLDHVTTYFFTLALNSLRSSTLLTIWIDTMKFGIRLETFRRNMLPTYSEFEIKPNMEKLIRIWERDGQDTSPGEGRNNRKPLWRSLGRV